MENGSQREEKLTTYCNVVICLPAIYVIDDVNADGIAEITNFKHPEGMSAVRYSKALWERALR